MQNIEDLPKTIICDIDGCILKHFGNLSDIITNAPEILNGVKQKFDEWDKKSHKIILLTGRRENLREITERQLHSFGLFWDNLVMGATRGQRILINDLKPDNVTETALAFNLKRNEGLGSCP
jgi:hydroxymethylpyrimidine pyrophosphatase-like HAD family hydrolase